MSDLGLGGTFPDNWSHPRSVYVNGQYLDDGFIWVGKNPVTVADVVALADAVGDKVKIDWRSLVGLYNRSWSTLFNKLTPGATPTGGEGSQAYENQLVGESQGVIFTKSPIWYYDSDGKMVTGIPGNAGEYHKKYVAGYEDIIEGPEPGSVAATMLGDGEYYWDAERALYDIRF